MAVPNIFAIKSGSVPAAQLDQNFAYVLANTVSTNSVNAYSALQKMVGHCFDFAKSADLASAATLNLNDPQAASNPGTVTGNYVTVTGTNTVTSVLLSSGASRIIRAAGAFTWTNNASVVVQGAANYTAAAGDFFIVQADDAGIVYVLVFAASGFITGSTGTGAVVRATSPTLVTPALGTPASVTLTNATGLPIATGVSGLGANVATFLATPSSTNLAAAVTGETGSGALVFSISPQFLTPLIDAATGVSVSLTAASTARNATATPAAASAVPAFIFGSAALGLYWGTGDPNTALTAPKGSLFIRTDGSSAVTRMYVNTDSSTAWTSITTAT